MIKITYNMTTTLKLAKKFILVTAALLSFATHAVEGPLYTFDVLAPVFKTPLRITSHLNEQQTQTVSGPEVEFVSEQTTLSAKVWKDMVAAGTAPSYDFVNCTKKTCTYGKKSKVNGSFQVSLYPTSVDGEVSVAFRASKTDVRLMGKTGEVASPLSDSHMIEGKYPLTAGSSYPVVVGANEVAVIFLVSVTE